MSSKQSPKTLVSGVKPTGRLHVGNYFGAVRQIVGMQKDFQSYIFIADLHALTTIQDSDQLSENIYNTAVDYLALGVDPSRTTLFKQSDIVQVAELAWIFNCITTMPYLMRSHAYKDAEAKNREINVGTFTYPLLMAADILVHDADVVPVGQDQKQHVEYARDVAEKFNRVFGETFSIPEAHILEDVKTIPGTDGRKMSKSYNNTIGLFAEDDEIKKAVMSIPTDSKSVDDPKDPESDHVFALYKHFAEKQEVESMRKRYEDGGLGYKEAKEILTESLINFISPLREKRKEVSMDKNKVLDILMKGGEEARKQVDDKMAIVRGRIGVTLR